MIEKVFKKTGKSILFILVPFDSRGGDRLKENLVPFDSRGVVDLRSDEITFFQKCAFVF